MAGNSFGTIFKVTTFGESHGAALGCVVDGCPAGLSLTTEDIARELKRRRPDGNDPASTTRSEADAPEILSGVYQDKTLGTPIAILIRNTNQKSGDYDALKDLYRPGHADWTWQAKYGIRDHRGGGRSSGRETAARVAAGAIAKVFLAANNIKVDAWADSIAGIACSDTNEELITKRIEELKAAGDSAGGIAACRITGLPAGLGEPVFDKLGALLGHAVLSIGACKGIEFGAGFAAASSTGLSNNDVPLIPPENHGNLFLINLPQSTQRFTEDEGIKTECFKTNNAGGMLGGISNGMDVFFRAAFKPVASVAAEQSTIDSSGNQRKISIQGRHDICIIKRVIPVVEAMAALVIADLLLMGNRQ